MFHSNDIQTHKTAEADRCRVLKPGHISIHEVSKRFRKHTLVKKSYSTLKTDLLGKIFRARYPKENYVNALKEISVEIAPGSSLGVVGGNGSGKSTLLKLIAGIYLPDQGYVRTNGRISALIELGAGFHPDFTGRENLYLGGVMYGLSRAEIEQRIDQIIAYAELEEFIDDPVRTYSSGMYMRLGFSLAVHTDPDILLIDEVLAVGDAAFIHRCQETISEFKRQGKTLIFVTHDLSSVIRWCDEAIWLHKGVVREQGDPRWVIDCYLQHVEVIEEKELATENLESGSSESATVSVEEQASSQPTRWGNREVEITAVRMLNRQGEAKWVFHDDEAVTVEVDYVFNKFTDDVVFGVGIIKADGLNIFGTNTDIAKLKVPIPEEFSGSSQLRGVYRFRIERLSLLEDSYYIDVAAHRKDGFPYDYHHLKYKFSVRSTLAHQGVFVPQHSWQIAADYVASVARENRVVRVGEV